MNNSNHSPLQQTKCDKTLFSVIVTSVFDRHNITVKYGWNINEIYPVLTQVSKSFCFIPVKFHV